MRDWSIAPLTDPFPKKDIRAPVAVAAASGSRDAARRGVDLPNSHARDVELQERWSRRVDDRRADYRAGSATRRAQLSRLSSSTRRGAEKRPGPRLT